MKPNPFSSGINTCQYLKYKYAVDYSYGKITLIFFLLLISGKIWSHHSSVVHCPKPENHSALLESEKMLIEKFRSWKNAFTHEDDLIDSVVFKNNGQKINPDTLELRDFCHNFIELQYLTFTEGKIVDSCSSSFKIDAFQDLTFSLPAVDFTCFRDREIPVFSVIHPPYSLTRLLNFSNASNCSIYQEGLLSVLEKEPIFEGTTIIFERIYTVLYPGEIQFNIPEKIEITHDYQAPEFTEIPVNIVLHCGDKIQDEPEIDVFDNSGSTVHLNFNEQLYFQSCGGRYFERTWTATDFCGNVSSKKQTVQLYDTIAPDLHISNDTNLLCSDIIPVPFYEASDFGCSSFEVEILEEKQEMDSCNFDLIRTFTVVDGCGNKTSKRQIIRVRDQIHKNPRNYLYHKNLSKTSIGMRGHSGDKEQQEGFEHDPLRGHSPATNFQADEPYLVYPNPVKDTLLICWQSKKPQTIHLALYDASGKIVHQQEEIGTVGSHQFHFNMRHLRSGAYVLQITREDQNQVFRIVKSI